MVEISLAVLALVLEALVIALIALVVLSVILLKRRARDRQAAERLIEQIKHQSQTRLESTGSFLNEKYRFEGEELKKAVKAIDKEEKKFIQTLLQVYLKRDADHLESIDAALAELIDTYKSLSPVMPEAGAVSEEVQQELESLRKSNETLKEELKITKETMSNMISEFGNMFGGGHDHVMAKNDVIAKVQERSGEATGEQAIVEEVPEDSSESPPEQASRMSVDDDDEIELSAADPALEDAGLDLDLQDQEDVLADEGVEELLNGIDLSDNK
jgi:hypothetical protein